jgi:hypothetical protein
MNKIQPAAMFAVRSLMGVVDSFGRPRLACGTSRIQICGPSFWCVCPKGFQQSGMGSRSWGISGFVTALIGWTQFATSRITPLRNTLNILNDPTLKSNSGS